MKYSNYRTKIADIIPIKECQRVLIVRLSALGDIALTLPFLPFLKARGCFVGWVVQEQNSEIIEGHPMVDRVYKVPWKKWKSSNCSWFKIWSEYREIIKCIKNDKYQVVIDAQGLFKSWIFAVNSGAIYHIVNRRAREFATLFATHLVDLPRDIHAKLLYLPHIFLHYLRPLGITIETKQELKVALPTTPPEVKNKITRLLQQSVDRHVANHDLPTGFPPIVIIAPTTTWPTKHWDAANWRALIAQLPDHWQLVFTGDQKSLPFIQKIARNQDIVLAGCTTLTELIALFRQSQLVISLDSGSTHLAWAAQKPKILAIYCATNCILYSQNTAIQNLHYRVVSGPILSCQPCCKRTCSLHGIKYNACTHLPSVEKVLKEALELMNNR